MIGPLFEMASPPGALDDVTLEKELNARQFEAVKTQSGPLLILAGAGSGKTRVITYRIARLISRGADPRSIMALTFTNKAAAEMKERTVALLRGRGRDLWISTFHSACLRILRANADRIGYPKDFTVYDAQDQTRVIKTCLADLGIDEKAYPARQIGSMISKFKNRMKGPVEAEAELNSNRHREFLEIFHLYEKKLSENRCMDFDDLLGKTVALFRKDEELRGMYQRRFDHVLVDEFQDTNVAQYEIVKTLVGAKRNVCVVGDDDQSIYQWRGANIENILNFEKDYPEARVVLLEQNYRSTGNILRSASAVVSRNPDRKDKTLWTENSDGEKINLFVARDEAEEAKYVADTIRRVTKGEGRSLNDVAVFYRTNSQSRVIEDTLRAEGFPYQMYGGLKFYDRKEVKDLLAYFRLAANPADAVSFKRVINTPPRGLGAVTVEKVERAATAEGKEIAAILDDMDSIEGLNAGTRAKLEKFREILSSVRSSMASLDASEALSQALETTGYMDWLLNDKNSESLSRIDNLNELVSAAAEFAERTGDKSVAAFLDQASLVSEADNVADGEGNGAVKLMTVHISKGLEFPVVFVTGLEDNLFPHARSKDDPRQMQEERRLLYVAMTRAKEKLYITRAEFRRMLGVAQANRASVFLDDLPPDTLNVEEPKGLFGGGGAFQPRTQFPVHRQKPAASAPAFPRARKEKVERSVDGLRVGMKVAHPRFEIGVIRDIEGDGDRSKITVYFPRHGSKKLVKKFANLKKV